jgi:hypothetical protein
LTEVSFEEPAGVGSLARSNVFGRAGHHQLGRPPFLCSSVKMKSSSSPYTLEDRRPQLDPSSGRQRAFFEMPPEVDLPLERTGYFVRGRT